MAELGYGQGYAYPHDYEGHWVPVRYLPDALKDTRFYKPTEIGYEKGIKDRLDEWRRKRDGGSGK